MTLAENFLTHIITRVLETHRADLKVIGRDVTKLEAIIAPRRTASASHSPSLVTTTRTDAPRRARRRLRLENAHGDDFGSPDETYISEPVQQAGDGASLPSKHKGNPYHMQPDPADPTKASSASASGRGYGEIIGGSPARRRLRPPPSRIESHNLPMDAFQWYLDLRKYGSVPHGGFGMGMNVDIGVDLPGWNMYRRLFRSQGR